jgi:hypothetical protein
MINVTLTYSPNKSTFPAGERIFPVGKVGVIVVYPDSIVGVWGRRPGGWENKVAFDPIPGRGLLRGAPATSSAAAEVAATAAVGGPVEPLRLPRLMARVPAGFDPADADQSALERAAGSSEGGLMLSAFIESMVRGPGGLFVPREFIPGPVAIEDVFEDVVGLVGDDGVPVRQAVSLLDIRKAGLARLAFTKKVPSREPAVV